MVDCLVLRLCSQHPCAVLVASIIMGLAVRRTWKFGAGAWELYCPDFAVHHVEAKWSFRDIVRMQPLDTSASESEMRKRMWVSAVLQGSVGKKLLA